MIHAGRAKSTRAYGPASPSARATALGPGPHAPSRRNPSRSPACCGAQRLQPSKVVLHVVRAERRPLVAPRPAPHACGAHWMHRRWQRLRPRRRRRCLASAPPNRCAMRPARTLRRRPPPTAGGEPRKGIVGRHDRLRRCWRHRWLRRNRRRGGWSGGVRRGAFCCALRALHGVAHRRQPCIVSLRLGGRFLSLLRGLMLALSDPPFEASSTSTLRRRQILFTIWPRLRDGRGLVLGRPRRPGFGIWLGHGSLVEIHDEAVQLDGASARTTQSVDSPSDLRELRLGERLAWCGRRAAPRLRRAFRRHSCQICTC